MTGGRVVYRHTLLVRITPWINVLCLAFLLTSGLQIFNAHPELNRGDKSDFGRPIFALYAARQGDAVKRVTRIGRARFATTGLLGVSEEEAR